VRSHGPTRPSLKAALSSIRPATFGFADPDARLGYPYVMNKIDFYIFDDPRKKPLRDAIHRAIKQLSAKASSSAALRRKSAFSDFRHGACSRINVRAASTGGTRGE